MLFFAIPFLVVPFITPSLSETDDKKVSQSGVESIGKILNIHNNTRNTIVIEYQYEHDGILKTEKFETVETHLQDQYKKGDDILILVSEHGSLIRDLERFKFPVLVFYMIPLIFLTVISPFVIAVLVNYIKLKTLYTNGHLSTGRIVSIKQGNSHSFIFFSDTFYTVLFKFSDSKNQEKTATSTTWNLALIANKNKGDAIPVIVFNDKGTIYDDE